MAEISNERYEELRLILEKQNRRSYTLEEAKEIGDGLIDFFELLANLNKDDSDEALDKRGLVDDLNDSAAN